MLSVQSETWSGVPSSWEVGSHQQMMKYIITA